MFHRPRKNSALLSDLFIAKVSTYAWGGRTRLAEQFGINPNTFEKWLTHLNRAPREHLGLLQIADIVGCPKEKIFRE